MTSFLICLCILVVRAHVPDEQVDQMLQEEGVTDGMARLVGKLRVAG